MALPRVAPRNGAGRSAALPAPLAPSEAARIKRILALQSRGNLAAAGREAAGLSDPTLLGHVLAHGYLSRHAAATPAQLTDWLARFAGEPDAPAIHARLARKLPKGGVPPLPATDILADGKDDHAIPEEIDRRPSAIKRDLALDRSIGARASAGDSRGALRLIKARRNLTPAYASLLRAEVAQQLFLQNHDQDAFDVAAYAVRITPPDQQSGLAGYVAGLAAWRMHRPELARSYFEGAWRAPCASPTVQAAGAYWAARSHLAINNAAGYAIWLQRAADGVHTFYGLIARRTLGIAPDFSRATETLGEADAEAIAATPRGRRALAYLQIGEPDLADAELRRLWPSVRDDAPTAHALMLVAGQAGLTDLAAEIAEKAQEADGRPRDTLRFPVPKLQPRGGFKVDPALVYGLTRVESNFDATAVSPAGARGLMQIMPVTAGYVDPSVAGSASRLHEPALNLDVGQRYVSRLADAGVVGGDLLRLLASYNSGPGSFGRWGPEIRDGGDPLMFIEAIPVTETRNFVRHVLFYTWIYAARLHLAAPSLDEIAAGRFPRLSRPERPVVLGGLFSRN